MGAAKRSAHDAQLEDPDYQQRMRGMRLGLVKAMQGSFAQALTYATSPSTTGSTELLLAELARITPYDNLEQVIAALRDRVDASPPTSPTRLRAVARAVEILMVRTAPDSYLRGKVGTLLLYAPTTECLRTIDATRDATPRPAANTPTSRNGQRAVLSGDIDADTPAYTACLREVASQAVEVARSNFPFFEAALAKVRGGVGADAAQEETHVLFESEPTGSVFSNVRKQTELLLLALVKAQGKVGAAAEANPTGVKQAELQPYIDILQSTAQGLVKTIGADGVEYAIYEGMREFVWKHWRHSGYTPLQATEAAEGGERSNTVKLPRAERHAASKPKGEPHIAGFLRGHLPDGVGQKQELTCKGFLMTAAMHLHPDAGMEKEYILTRNPLFVWRAFRLLINSSEYDLPPKAVSTSCEDLESTIQKHWPTLGEEELQRQMNDG